MPTVHVATANGVHSWVEAVAPQVSLHGSSITTLARSGEDLWAIVEHQHLWKRGTSGWERVADLDGFRATCLAMTRVGLLVGTTEAHLFRLDGDDGLRRVDAFDRIAGRDGWYTPWGGPPDTRSISEWDEDVYVNVHVGGIPRIDDGNSTWAPTIDVDADVHQVATAEGSVLAACADGLAVSTDRGATWTTRSHGLEGRYCRAVAVCGDRILLTSSRGPRGGDAAIYRGPIEPGPFARLDAGPGHFDGNIDTHWLDALPDGSLAAFGTADGHLYVSTDGGSTWVERASRLPQIRRVLVMP